MNFIGRSVPRLEDLPLVTGNGRFAADVSFPHQLHMRVVRSPHAHGRIRAIDADAARKAQENGEAYAALTARRAAAAVAQRPASPRTPQQG